MNKLTKYRPNSTVNTARITITLPKHQLAFIDENVADRLRSRFIADAVEMFINSCGGENNAK